MASRTQRSGGVRRTFAAVALLALGKAAYAVRRAARRPQVKDFETFRSKLPAGTQLFVATNTLVKTASAGTALSA